MSVEEKKKDVLYEYENRKHTDFARRMKVYGAIKEEVKRVNPKNVKDKNNFIVLDLSVLKISKKSGLRKNIVRKKLEELKDFGAIDYDIGRGDRTTIYFTYNKESSFHDEMLEIAEKERII